MEEEKKVILQDLMDIKPTLSFMNVVDDVNDKSWSAWKRCHRFTSATWDFLLSHPKAEYFKRRLQNDLWRKRAKDVADKFPEVHHMFQRFMKMKYQLLEHSGEVQMRGIDIAARSLVPSRHYRYLNWEVNLGVLDVRKIPRGKKTERGGDVNWFLNMLAEKLESKMTEPNVWLLIMETKEELEVTTAFVELALSAYDKVSSTYVLAKAERLNNVTNRSIAPDVPLLFLFKRENGFAESVRNKVLP